MQNDRIRFQIGWALVTLAGYVIGSLAILPFAVNLAYATQPQWLIGLVSGAIIGGAIGLAQWLLLRRRTPVTTTWVIASIVGGMVGMALGLTFAESAIAPPVPAATRAEMAAAVPWRVALQTGISGALFGLGLGAAQWWVLRQYARSTGWWVLTNGVGWMLGMGVGAAIAETVTVIGALLVGGLIAAAITGYVMEQWQWEMRKRTGPIPGRG